MKKSKKILIIIGVSLVVLLAIAFCVLFYLYPDAVKYYLNTAWEWVNKPLPVVGVSVLMLVILVWKMFASSSLGKKQIKTFKEKADEVEIKFNETKQEWETNKEMYEEKMKDLQAKLDAYRLLIKHICETIPNKKVKAIGEQIDGKETIDNETKAD